MLRTHPSCTADHEAEELASCNTEKDKGELKNATTCGVIATVWACGIVIGLQEMYGAESKSQVYVHLLKL
jgi:hypothetical protein